MGGERDREDRWKKIGAKNRVHLHSDMETTRKRRSLSMS
jgi:hypothetical protein